MGCDDTNLRDCEKKIEVTVTQFDRMINLQDIT